MSCGSGHLGFPIGIKNRNFVEDLPMISQTVHECSLDGPLQTLGFLFRYEIQNGGYVLRWRPSWISDRHKKHKICRVPSNDHSWSVWFHNVFCSDIKLKMAATAGLSLRMDPMGKMFQNASSLKPLGQLKPNCPVMIIGRSSTKFRFFMPIENSRWPPSQDGTKNVKFVEDHPMNIHVQFGFNNICSF
jgi:hypothetical protein